MKNVIQIIAILHKCTFSSHVINLLFVLSVSEVLIVTQRLVKYQND